MLVFWLVKTHGSMIWILQGSISSVITSMGLQKGETEVTDTVYRECLLMVQQRTGNWNTGSMADFGQVM